MMSKNRDGRPRRCVIVRVDASESEAWSERRLLAHKIVRLTLTLNAWSTSRRRYLRLIALQSPKIRWVIDGMAVIGYYRGDRLGSLLSQVLSSG